jgi:hypothetical protein
MIYWLAMEKSKGCCSNWLALLCMGVLGFMPFEPNALAGQTWAYQLAAESTLTDACRLCGLPPVSLPMRGTFTLTLQSINPLFAQYTLDSIAFTAGNGTNVAYQVAGQGNLQFGGEVAVVQNMTLQVQVNGMPFGFTNGVTSATRTWPVIGIDLTQTNRNFAQLISLHLLAVPVREIWFATARGFTPANLPAATNGISPGDLISTSGRVVLSNAQLVNALSPQASSASLALAAVDVGAGGEVLFALSQGVVSKTLGSLHQGDLMSDRGRVVKRNQDLTAPFGPMPIAPDVGLSGVQTLPNGEFLFAIQRPLFSELLGTNLLAGDILSTSGHILRTSQQLYAHFTTGGEAGLTSFYMWPSGEIWFTPATGFRDPQLGPIQAGDLLSDQGYIVFRNLDLVSAFAPRGDITSFGLNALFVITDVTPPAAAPSILPLSLPTPNGARVIQWSGRGKVFQLQKALNVDGPYLPISPIIPDMEYLDAAAGPSQPEAYYRVGQW